MDDLTANRGSQLVTVSIAFTVLVWIAVSLRCYVRLLLIREFKLDDWFILVATSGFTVMTSFIFVGVQYGLGMHNQALPLKKEILALKYQALATIVYIADMAFLKVSIAIFLLRIAVSSRYIWILRVSIGIVVTWTTAIFLYNVFQCTPVQGQWDITIGAKCVSGSSYVSAAYAFSILAVLSDWLYALIPIPMIWKVKMNTQTKFSVMVILALGIFASVATLVRLVYLANVANFDDILYTATDTMLWTIAEPGIGIIAASVMTLRPLLRAMKVSGFSTAEPSGKSNTGGGISTAQGPYSRAEELSSLPSRSGMSKNHDHSITIVQQYRVSITGSDDSILAHDFPSSHARPGPALGR
ncbi:hypothetical protein BP5796_11989 [Coleophoma crateriformis]|uniref:Rhodopsin domain-containing protein n=1 Tax=Coleophoma crateriformis TaxID=565419 RepID=A0A3D8QB43_9HELO|nr:hypothetical protein BP5796_11989 [Coleophoma crateriformis]